MWLGQEGYQSLVKQIVQHPAPLAWIDQQLEKDLKETDLLISHLKRYFEFVKTGEKGVSPSTPPRSEAQGKFILRLKSLMNQNQHQTPPPSLNMESTNASLISYLKMINHSLQTCDPTRLNLIPQAARFLTQSWVCEVVAACFKDLKVLNSGFNESFSQLKLMNQQAYLRERVEQLCSLPISYQIVFMVVGQALVKTILAILSALLKRDRKLFYRELLLGWVLSFLDIIQFLFKGRPRGDLVPERELALAAQLFRLFLFSRTLLTLYQSRYSSLTFHFQIQQPIVKALVDGSALIALPPFHAHPRLFPRILQDVLYDSADQDSLYEELLRGEVKDWNEKRHPESRESGPERRGLKRWFSKEQKLLISKSDSLLLPFLQINDLQKPQQS